MNAADYEDLVKRDVRGEVTEEEASGLRNGPEAARSWARALGSILRETDAALVALDIEVRQRLAASIAEGPDTKEAFFRWKEPKNKERSQLVQWKKGLVGRLREAKMISRGAREDDQSDIMVALARVEAKMDRILALLKNKPEQ